MLPIYGPRAADWRSKQRQEFIDREIRVPNDCAQEGLFNRPASVNRDHRSSPCLGVDQNQMTSFLPVFDETSTLVPESLSAQSEQEFWT